MTMINCATGTLAPYTPSASMPWDNRRARHLFRRAGFGATAEQIEQALATDPQTLVNALVDEALAMPLPEEPEWAYWTFQDYDDFQDEARMQIRQWSLTWMEGMLQGGMRDKLALFWHNHFVTQLGTYACPSYLYQYHKILQENALGDFRQFVHDIGLTPAMLFFLNGAQNSAANPNENYARELYELFTLGQGNGYTQTDIEETARALTGWNPQPDIYDECGPINFVPARHDDGIKTIFGQTGNWGYEDVVNLVFEQRPEEMARHICREIYMAFVNPCVDEDIVDEMTATFMAENFQLAPMLRQLFMSEHFFDDANIGVVVKSPLEHFLTFLKEGNLPAGPELLLELLYFAAVLGQELWHPTDVSGWPGNTAWINGNNLTSRWSAMEWMSNAYLQFQPESLRELAKILADESNDPEYITQVIVDAFTPTGLQSPVDYEVATVVFKYDIPQNYYDDGSWNLDWEEAPEQVSLLLAHVSRQPEFQLM